MLNEVYKRNIELDQIFNDNYSSDTDVFKSNCIELLVELGEFINETKCFKYWSTKKTNKEMVLEEYADVITMILYFANLNRMDITNYKITSTDKDLLELINETYNLCTNLMDNMTEDLVGKILTNALQIAYLLDLKEEEIIEAIKHKHEIVYERLNSDY